MKARIIIMIQCYRNMQIPQRIIGNARDSPCEGCRLGCLAFEAPNSSSCESLHHTSRRCIAGEFTQQTAVFPMAAADTKDVAYLCT